MNKLEDEIEDKLKKVLHIDDLEKQLMSVFHEDRTGDSSEKLSSSQGGVSKVHQVRKNINIHRLIIMSRMHKTM